MSEWGKWVREREQLEKEQQPKQPIEPKSENNTAMEAFQLGVGLAIGEILVQGIIGVIVLGIIWAFFKFALIAFLMNIFGSFDFGGFGTAKKQPAPIVKTASNSVSDVPSSASGLVLDYVPPKNALHTSDEVIRSVIIRLRNPPYPNNAKRLGHSGIVSYAVNYDGRGAFVSAKLIKSSGHGSLDDAALKAIGQSIRFNPYSNEPLTTVISCGFFNGISDCQEAEK